jgi:CheY-like chemotaxis protein
MPPRTLLIVDDSKLSRMMVRSIVLHAHPDWHIIEAENGAEALAKASSAQVDIMTLDFNMPGMDGLTLAEQLKETFPLASMALLTANIQHSIQERASRLGIGCIHKPITEAKILSYIEA